MNKIEYAAIWAAESTCTQATTRNAERSGALQLVGAAGVLLSALCLAACGQKDFQGDGFKGVKYGMSSQQLEAAGFKCDAKREECKRSGTAEDTLFGMPANLQAELNDDKLIELSVGVGTTQKKLVELYEDALGKATVSEFNCFNAKCTSYNWKSSEGTMIEVIFLAGEKMTALAEQFTGPRAHASYLDKSSTARLLKMRDDKTKINAKDF